MTDAVHSTEDDPPGPPSHPSLPNECGAGLLVTLCTYNEAENLKRLVSEILDVAPQAHVLIVDDGSPDGTGRIADGYAKRDRRVHVLHRQEKLGLGTATLMALRHGLEQGYDRLINMDADFSHPPEYIPDLLARADEADVVVGSRYVPGGGIVGWGWLRHFMSRGVNIYTRLMLGLRTRDCSGSFRCYDSRKLVEVDFSAFRSHGYAVEEELLYRCDRAGCTFTEVPIVFEDRRYGESKINWREVLRAIRDIFLLGCDRLRRTNSS